MNSGIMEGLNLDSLFPEKKEEPKEEIKEEEEPTKETTIEDKYPIPELEQPIKYYQELLYKLCKENYPELIRIAKLFLERARNDYDNHIAIEGITGSGKSMFALIIILLMEHIAKLKFNMVKQVLFIPDEGELRRAIQGLPELGVYWIDEAIRALDKKRWYNADQIELNHIIKTERWKRNTVIYCMPDFSEFSNSFRTSNIYFRVYIVPRTAAIINIKDIDKDIEDPWHRKVNSAMKFQKKSKKSGFMHTRYNAVMTNKERLDKEIKLPNYFTHSSYPDLAKDHELSPVWNHYIALKERSRAIDREKAKNQRTEAKVRTTKAQDYKDTIGVLSAELSKVLGKSRKKIYKELKLDRFIGNTLYYQAKLPKKEKELPKNETD